MRGIGNEQTVASLLPWKLLSSLHLQHTHEGSFNSTQSERRGWEGISSRCYDGSMKESSMHF